MFTLAEKMLINEMSPPQKVKSVSNAERRDMIAQRLFCRDLSF